MGGYAQANLSASPRQEPRPGTEGTRKDVAVNEDQLKQSIKSQSTKRLNPHLFGPASGLGGHKPKWTEAQTLVESKPERQRGTPCVVEVCILSLRTSELDDDNLAGAHKAFRDVIAKTLGIDDGDSRIRFRYIQGITKSKPHTLVIINKVYDRRHS